MQEFTKRPLQTSLPEKNECSFIVILLCADRRFAICRLEKHQLFELDLSGIWTSGKIILFAEKSRHWTGLLFEHTVVIIWQSPPDITLIFSQSEYRHSRRLSRKIFKWTDKKARNLWFFSSPFEEKNRVFTSSRANEISWCHRENSGQRKL